MAGSVEDFAVVLKAVLEAILEALEVDLGQVPEAVYKYLVWRNSSKSSKSSALNCCCLI